MKIEYPYSNPHARLWSHTCNRNKRPSGDNEVTMRLFNYNSMLWP